MQRGVAVHPWPSGLLQALADLNSDIGLTVISVPTPLTASRPEARLAIRHALQSTVAAWLNLPVAAVTVLSRPGQPVQVLARGASPYTTISHTAGLSVAALCTHRAVGVDVMAADAQTLPPDWAAVARDYLGPGVAQSLHHETPAQRPAAFAQAWVSLEARLKCLGLGLTEWTPALAVRLSECQLVALNGLPGVCGAVALEQAAPLPRSAN